MGLRRNRSLPDLLSLTLQKATVSCALAASLAAVVAVGLHTSGWLQPIEHAVQEARFSLLDRPVSGEIVYVDIDAQSLQRVGVWPWPRGLHGVVVDRLREAGASEIYFDVDFSAQSEPEQDAKFAAALERAEGTAHLATFRQPVDPVDPAAGEIVNTPLPVFLEHAWPVSVSLPLDADGRIRSALYADIVNGETVLSLSSMAAGATGEARQAFGIDFALDPLTIPRFSVEDVLLDRLPTGVLDGRKVVIGASAQELRDYFAVPVHGVMAGVVLQILAAETLISGRPIISGYGYVLLALVLAVGALATLAGVHGWRPRLALFLVLAAGLEVAGLWIQSRTAVSLDTVPAQLALAILAVATLLREIGMRQILLRLLRRQRQQDLVVLDRVFADSFDGVVVVDREGLVRAASRNAEVIWNTPIAVGDPVSRLLPRAIIDKLEAARNGTLATDQLDEIIVPGQDDNSGERIIEYAITASSLAVEDGDEPDSVVCLTCRDVTDRRRAEEAAAYLASHDPTTDLPDRRAFEAELQVRFDRGQARQCDYHLLVAGLERIDLIAASLGLAWADKVRAAIAGELRQLGCEFVANVGDRQFALAGFPDDQSPRAVCDRVLERISRELTIEGHRLNVSACIGLATLPSGDKGDAAALLRQAGTALSWARKAGQGAVREFDQTMHRALSRRRLLELDLEEGISKGQFNVVYQPQVLLQTGEIVGVEALLRWNHPELGHISPVEFIQIAEESGLIEPLGAFVLREACATVALWPSPLRLAVNVSPLQIERGSVIGAVETALQTSGLPASQLDLELVESLFLGQAEQVQASIAHLRGLGCGLALDDFGSGYSSLGYIPRFPFSKIKIDRSFIERVAIDKGSAAIVRSVVELARGFDITVVAEGIETRAQEDAVRRLGCDIGQGYLYGRPMSGEDLLALMRTAA